jgi:Phage terminase large subunit gpA, ATPase domain
VYLRKKPISFADRPYLYGPYHSKARRLVIRASRQVEKSTLLVNTILYGAVQNPGIHILFVCPRQEQACLFSNTRLMPAIDESPLIRRRLRGRRPQKQQVMNLRFVNGSKVFIRAAYNSADPVRGIDADLLLVDEFQDVASGHLPVLEETLSHSKLRRVILTGTPKTVDNHLDGCFRRSTACEFKLPCRDCRDWVILDEHCLGPTGVVCPNCQKNLDVKEGRWIARNPRSAWGDGYWINHLMVPWLNYHEFLEKQRSYDLAMFKNECLGLPTVLGDHIVTRAELEACCTDLAMACGRADVPHPFCDRLIAGIDWGGGATSRTVLTIGYMDEAYKFHVIYLERFAAREEPDLILTQVAERCRLFGVRLLGADGGGNGHVYNRLLLDRLADMGPPFVLFAVMYSNSAHEPYQDGMLWRWTVNRSASLGVIFTRVKKQRIAFPPVEECGSYLDEVAGEVAEYDDHLRCVKYTHPETQPDDCLHALNYALLVACSEFVRRTEMDSGGDY